ncbi:MAG: pyridoxal-dependent decarboxylase [Pseudomonadota bacterium]
MDKSEFERWATRATNWSSEYLATIGDRPVRSQVDPGDIARLIEPSPPEEGESMEKIMDDFERIIPDGMTHWQHPRFFAYFPSNASPASMIAEQLASTLAAQCMLWQTSPAATELETCMVDWLRQGLGLPETFKGVLQDTASNATLAAILTMRERALSWKGNLEGLSGHPRIRVYASTRTHSSIDKGMWIAGLGQENLVKIPTDDTYAMREDLLEAAILEDRAAGYLPAGIVICVGGTSMGATDRVAKVCEIAQSENLYTHVDAAWAGSAMICEELRSLWSGVEAADSLVFNPHKWLGASMECSAHFVKDPDVLVRTLAIQPEYLKTHGKDGLVNYSEWGIQLGRRFRALKLWFLMRAYGLEGLRVRIRNHIRWSQALCERLRLEADFEIVTNPILSLFTFRFAPAEADDLNQLNVHLVNTINDSGRIYLTQTEHDGALVIRFMAGQFDMGEQDIDVAFTVITETARTLKPPHAI